MLSASTPIFTTGGWKTVGSVKAGDELFGYDGLPYPVLAAPPTEMATSTVEVSFSDGSHLVTSRDHYWSFETVNSRKALGRSASPRVKPVAISSIDLIEQPVHRARKDGIVEHLYSAPAIEPLELPERDYKVEPYMMGRTVGQYKGIFGQELPEEYLMGSIAQRYAFLRGLYDSRRLIFWPSKKQFRVQSANLRLLIQIQELVESLGHRTIMVKYRGRGDALIFKAHLPYEPASEGPVKSVRRQVVGAARGPSSQVRKIVIESPSNLFAAGPTLIPTHG
jgi:hypothetical protein